MFTVMFFMGTFCGMVLGTLITAVLMYDKYHDNK